MALEIERKFLVHKDRLPGLVGGCRMLQAYIPTSNGTTVRVRLEGDQAFLCVKTRATNFTRREFQYCVPVGDAMEMLEFACDPARVEKTRFVVNHAGTGWEIDVFSGANEGLVVAEVELLSEDQQLELPAWVAEEVTHDPRYSNFRLARNPVSTW